MRISDALLNQIQPRHSVDAIVCSSFADHHTEDQMKCLKCKSEMAQGFVADYSMAAALVASWHAGHPKKKLVGHTKGPRSEGLPIGAFRCQKCGFLEFYADPQFAAQ